MENDKLKISAEFIRKLIHIFCSILPLSYWYFLTWEQIIAVSGFITIGFVIAEILRFRNHFFKKQFQSIFFKLLREDEKSKRITGATFLFMALTVIFIIFDKQVSVPAALCLTLADSMAAIIGKKYGGVKYFNKTVTGSATFYLVGVAIFFLFLYEFGWLNLLIVFLITTVEALPIKLSDNITIPLSAAILIEISNFVFGGIL